MFAIKSIVVKPNDTYTTVSGLYTGRNRGDIRR